MVTRRAPAQARTWFKGGCMVNVDHKAKPLTTSATSAETQRRIRAARKNRRRLRARTAASLTGLTMVLGMSFTESAGLAWLLFAALAGIVVAPLAVGRR